MTEDAVRKINAEMQAHPADRQLEAIGEYIIDRVSRSEAYAEKVMQEGKTLDGCCKKITEKAKALAGGAKMVMVKDVDVYGWADIYFGFKDGDDSTAAPVTGTPSTAALDIDLSDFL